MVADGLTVSVARYCKDKGIMISAVSRGTNISADILRRCLSAKNRVLRAEEFMKICSFLEKDPSDFFPNA